MRDIEMPDRDLIPDAGPRGLSKQDEVQPFAGSEIKFTRHHKHGRVDQWYEARPDRVTLAVFAHLGSSSLSILNDRTKLSATCAILRFWFIAVFRKS